MTGRHAAESPRHGHWTPQVPAPAWPLSLERTGSHRVVRAETLASLARPGEATARLLRAVRRPG